MSAPTRLWLIGATHEAFGEEGVREYRGTHLGAVRAANRIARRGGHGWVAWCREQPAEDAEARS